MPKGYKIVQNRKPLISELLCFCNVPVQTYKKKKKKVLIFKQKVNCSVCLRLILPLTGTTPGAELGSCKRF